MAADRLCSQCGSPLPPGDSQGRCPACLLRAGLETGSGLPAGPLDTRSEGTGEFAPAPGDGPTVTAHPPVSTEGSDTTIGPYKLVQRIGAGGMGAVFMAEQAQPVRRTVALKVIKPGMDTGQVIARFEAERQALALMDHPNIARVLDAGATATGRPYFVMELVRGVPINEYCDHNRLSPDERLALFIPVCKAIQHAHQKGIIHRDIKPSNVLVTLQDGKPVPKVIDFGVAKAIDQRLTEKTMFTEFGAVIGTLEYMSPEQAEMGALDIDTRSDIYSLGVMLYELLTGSTPLERARLRKAAYSEILRRIREEEPARPSTRLSESKDALPSISAQRKMEPARLTKLVRGDLDWIVMKSLEKDRTRRYETATGFARDIERYLAGDAVEACPPSATYKLRKFARKHRTALAIAGAFALLLVAATALNGGLAWWANRARVRAVQAEALAKVQQGRAEEREQLAINAVKQFRDAVSESPGLKDNPALAPLRATLLNEPLAFFKTLRDQLQEDHDTQPESLARLASAAFELGKLSDEIGNKQDALRAFEESLAIRARRARDDPSVAAFQAEVALCYSRIGAVQVLLGRSTEALAALQRARDIQEPLARANPKRAEFASDLAKSHIDIGRVYSNTGRPVDAMASYTQARAIQDRLARENPSVIAHQRALARCEYFIAGLEEDSGRMPEALASFERVRAIQERLVNQDPAVAEFQSDLGNTDMQIGDLLHLMGRLKEASAPFDQARAIQERLARENPSVTAYQTDLANLYGRMGLYLRDNKQTAEALTTQERGLAINEKLVRENPSVSRFRANLAGSHDMLGTMQRHVGRQAEAIESHERARVLREELTRAEPSVTEYQCDLIGSYLNLGILYLLQGRAGRAKALASYEQARAIAERLVSTHPEFIDGQERLAHTLHMLGQIDLREQRYDQAHAKFTQAVARGRHVVAANPNSPRYRNNLGVLLKNLVAAAKGLGRADLVAEAQRQLKEFRDSDPKTPQRDAELTALEAEAPNDAAAQLKLGLALVGQGKQTEASAAFREAIRLEPDLADAHYNLGRTLNAQKKYSEAVGPFHQAIRLKPDFAAAHRGLGLALDLGGDRPSAVKSFREAVRLEPNVAAYQNSLGIALMGTQDAEAVAAFRAALRLEPANERIQGDLARALNNLGMKLRLKGKLAQAIAALREANGLAPSLPIAYDNLGQALVDQGKPSEAAEAFRRAIAVLPTHAQYHFHLGNVLYLDGKPDEATKAYHEAIRLKPDDPEALRNLGRLLRDQAKLDLAIEQFHEALRVDPADEQAREHLGGALLAQGKRDVAVAEFRTVIAHKPNNDIFLMNLVSDLIRNGAPSDAEAVCRETILLQPDKAGAYDQLSLALKARGNFAESLAALRQAAARAKPGTTWARSATVRIGQLERMVALAGRLPAVLKGEDKPADLGEVDIFSLLCHDQGRYAAAARLLADALAADPKLKIQLSRRYLAACAAARAGWDQSRDDPPIDEPARATLRQQALDELKHQQAVWASVVEKNSAKDRALAVTNLRSWYQNRNLAGVRDGAAITRLPEAEQAAWRALWADVERVELEAEEKDNPIPR
jgi:tetratricopeptide (TPR) repeat protein/serine/threonine protein kinase